LYLNLLAGEPRGEVTTQPLHLPPHPPCRVPQRFWGETSQKAYEAEIPTPPVIYTPDVAIHSLHFEDKEPIRGQEEVLNGKEIVVEVMSVI
jgi:hypothetical protein